MTQALVLEAGPLAIDGVEVGYAHMIACDKVQRFGPCVYARQTERISRRKWRHKTVVAFPDGTFRALAFVTKGNPYGDEAAACQEA